MKFSQFLILIFFIIAFSHSSFSQQQTDTSKVLLTFNEPMSRDGIFDIQNYHIYKDDLTPVKIYKVGVAKGDTLIVLFTEKQSPNSIYKVIINNLKDKSGNIISQSHNTAVY
jgi:hypothetical protein